MGALSSERHRISGISLLIATDYWLVAGNLPFGFDPESSSGSSNCIRSFRKGKRGGPSTKVLEEVSLGKFSSPLLADRRLPKLGGLELYQPPPEEYHRFARQVWGRKNAGESPSSFVSSGKKEVALCDSLLAVSCLRPPEIPQLLK